MRCLSVESICMRHTSLAIGGIVTRVRSRRKDTASSARSRTSVGCWPGSTWRVLTSSRAARQSSPYPISWAAARICCLPHSSSCSARAISSSGEYGIMACRRSVLSASAPIGSPMRGASSPSLTPTISRRRNCACASKAFRAFSYGASAHHVKSGWYPS
jgi:hypothetical protein